MRVLNLRCLSADTVPLTSHAAGISTAPGGSVGLTSGYASRSHYFWAGANYQRTLERSGDRLGAVTSWSLVYGYRPPAWRLDYPKPDLRLFVEAVGDSTAPTRQGGNAMSNTGGQVMLVGPTALLLYKAYGIEGGILFPFYQRPNGTQSRERFRFGVNFTYFFLARLHRKDQIMRQLSYSAVRRTRADGRSGTCIRGAHGTCKSTCSAWIERSAPTP